MNVNGTKPRVYQSLGKAPKTILLQVPQTMVKRLNRLKDSYQNILNLKVTKSFLIRQAVTSFLSKSERELSKAKNGRLHAKARKTFSVE